MNVIKIMGWCLLVAFQNSYSPIVLNGNSTSNRIQNVVSKTKNMNGQLDQTFWLNNNVNPKGTSFIHGSISNIAAGYDPYDQINAIAVLPNGKIITAGFTGSFAGSADYVYSCYFALAQFNPDGSLDTSFGQNGTYTTSFISGTVFINQSISGVVLADLPFDAINGLVVQPDGKIVVAGFTTKEGLDEAACYVALARFNADGSLDETFGHTDLNTQSLFPGTVYINRSISGTEGGYIQDIMNAIALQEDGSLVVGGSSYYYPAATPGKFCAFARFTTDGILDQTFGITGTDTQSVFSGTVWINKAISGQTGVSVYDFLYGLAIQSDGAIVGSAVTYKERSPNYAYLFAALRLTADGALDQAFGVDGDYTTSVFPGTVYINGSLSGTPMFSHPIQDYPYGIILQQDGKIVLGGYSLNNGRSSNFWALARLTYFGGLDETFLGDSNTTVSYIPGTVVLSNSLCSAQEADDEIYALALQNDQKIVAVGYTHTVRDFNSTSLLAAGRFMTNGSLDQTFGATSDTTTSFIPGTVFLNNSLCGSTTYVYDWFKSAVVTSDGAIIGGGYTGDASSFDGYFALAKFFNPATPASYKEAYTKVGAGING